MKRNKNISLFIACMCAVMSGISLYNIFISNTENDFIGALTTFNLCVMIAFVGLWDYDYLSKKK